MLVVPKRCLLWNGRECGAQVCQQVAGVLGSASDSVGSIMVVMLAGTLVDYQFQKPQK